MNNKGFTMAELLIVMAIMAVLIAVAIPTFTDLTEKNGDTNQTIPKESEKVENKKEKEDMPVQEEQQEQVQQQEQPAYQEPAPTPTPEPTPEPAPEPEPVPEPEAIQTPELRSSTSRYSNWWILLIT